MSCRSWLQRNCRWLNFDNFYNQFRQLVKEMANGNCHIITKITRDKIIWHKIIGTRYFFASLKSEILAFYSLTKNMCLIRRRSHITGVPKSHYRSTQKLKKWLFVVLNQNANQRQNVMKISKNQPTHLVFTMSPRPSGRYGWGSKPSKHYYEFKYDLRHI